MPSRKKRKPLTLHELKGSMSTALLELERIYMNHEKHEPDTIIRAVNSLASLANSYTRLTETHELVERIEKLEQQQLRKAG